MPGRVEERYEDEPFAPNSVADDGDETEQEIMQMWQRVRERLLDQKAHEVLQELVREFGNWVMYIHDYLNES